MIVHTGRPIASSAVCPNSRSAAGFQSVMTPSRSLARIASREPLTIAASRRSARSPSGSSVNSPPADTIQEDSRLLMDDEEVACGSSMKASDSTSRSRERGRSGRGLPARCLGQLTHVRLAPAGDHGREGGSYASTFADTATPTTRRAPTCWHATVGDVAAILREVGGGPALRRRALAGREHGLVAGAERARAAGRRVPRGPAALHGRARRAREQPGRRHLPPRPRQRDRDARGGPGRRGRRGAARRGADARRCDGRRAHDGRRPARPRARAPRHGPRGPDDDLGQQDARGDRRR